MEAVCIKFEDNLLHDMEETMKKNRYATKTEFVREAVRDKIRELEKEEALLRLKKIYGASKRKTTEEDLHRAGEKAFEELERKFK